MTISTICSNFFKELVNYQESQQKLKKKKSVPHVIRWLVLLTTCTCSGVSSHLYYLISFNSITVAMKRNN